MERKKEELPLGEREKKVQKLRVMMFQAAVGGCLWREQTDTQRLGGHTAEMWFYQLFFQPY